MNQPHPLQTLTASRGLVIEDAPRFHVASVGARQRDDKIQLRSASDNITNATQNSVYLPEAAEPVKIKRFHVGRLKQQLFVCHGLPPVSVRGQTTTKVAWLTLNYRSADTIQTSVASESQFETILDKVPRSGTSDCRRPGGFGSFGQRNDKRLDDIGQFGQRKRKPRDDDANGILSAENHNPNDALDNSDFVDAVEKNLLHIVRVDHVHGLSPLKTNSQFADAHPGGTAAAVTDFFHRQRMTAADHLPRFPRLTASVTSNNANSATAAGTITSNHQNDMGMPS